MRLILEVFNVTSFSLLDSEASTSKLAGLGVNESQFQADKTRGTDFIFDANYFHNFLVLQRNNDTSVHK